MPKRWARLYFCAIVFSVCWGTVFTVVGFFHTGSLPDHLCAAMSESASTIYSGPHLICPPAIEVRRINVADPKLQSPVNGGY